MSRTEFPLITVRFTGEAASDESFDQYLAELKENYRKREAFILLFDARKAALPKFIHQKRQAQWMKEHEALINQYCLGVAYVVAQPLIRGALRTILKLQNSPLNSRVFGDLEKARSWCFEIQGT